MVVRLSLPWITNLNICFEEIEIVCGSSEKNSSPKSFFAVNLSDKDMPILILKNALNSKTDDELKSGEFMKRVHVLSGAFLDENTVLAYNAYDHVDKIYHVIQEHYKSALLDCSNIEECEK